MTTSPLFSDLELQARELLNLFPADKATTATMTVKMVFKAQYGSALTVERIEAIGSALVGIEKVNGIQDALTTFVRKGILRTRRHCGKKLYEINFAE